MRTEYLESLVTVVECGSLAEAARKLNLNPATLAARLHALEEEIGAPLVQRAGRTIQPTQAALNILEQSRAVLRHIRDLGVIAQARTALGELRLGVFVSALPNFLPGVMERVYAAHPALKAYIQPGSSLDLCRSVEEGHLDAAVIVEPQFAIAKSCRWARLVDDPLIVLAPASLRDSRAHDVLRDHPFIRYDRTTPTGQLIDRYLRDHAIRPIERLEVNSAAAIAAMVARGLGVSLVPAWTCPCNLGRSLARLRLPGKAVTRSIGLIWSTTGVHAQLAELLLREARVALRSHL
ncbi:MAG: LysR substrate-binding domain-containing protein [Pigmentiphaga sp.]|uniref:LysR substrate-binding domain-containing protein n=1 Tax=Pigmentiphaga sp. TaxID=1977564 RepID=UPI0029BC2DD3|nr:LysR substrate-binding domain-containing protein [Pigmentiphaga sp.]MDX3904361.1 LysR substrate-binding domain-containing protein [Pigmentiphaga sp.]